MFARISFIVMLGLVLAACGAAAPAATEVPHLIENTPLPSATLGEPAATALPTPDAPTATGMPPVEASLTPTETLLPPPELPSPVASPPARQSWIDEPSYPVQSGGPLSFRVYYDPDVWAPIVDSNGATALAHRQIPYCQITRTRGRGLSPGWTAENASAHLGLLDFDVSRISQNGQLKFVNYFGGFQIYTGFEVSFEGQSDGCIRDAEAVLATLQTLSGPFNPTPTPTQ